MSRTLRVVSVAACALLLWILVWVVLAPVLPSDAYSRGVVAVLAVVFLLVTLGLAWLLERATPWLERHTVVRRAGVAAAVASVFGVQLRTGIAIRYPPGWDAGIMEILAHGVAYDYLPTERAVLSIDQYPNNALLTALLTRWLELCRWGGVDDYELQFVGINALVMCASVALAYAVARRIASPATAYVTLFLAGALLTLSPWIGVAYSDTLGMIFPIAIAWLYVRLRSVRSRPVVVALWFALAVVASLGYQVKPTVIFAAGAAVAVALIGLHWRTWSRATITWRGIVAVALAAGFLAGGAIGARVVGGVGLTPTAGAEQVALPATHFLMMGAQDESFWGAYYGDDVTLTRSIPPGRERFVNGIRVYGERVSDMGVVGYATFLHDKANWTYGDGSFFAFGEGGMKPEPIPWASTDPLSRSIQNWMGPRGAHFGTLLAWWQVVWLSVLALVAVPAVWWRRELFTPSATMLRVGILMLTAFLLLFEARPRYLYLYLPFFFVLAAVSAVSLVGARRARREVPADESASGSMEA